MDLLNKEGSNGEALFEVNEVMSLTSKAVWRIIKSLPGFTNETYSTVLRTE